MTPLWADIRAGGEVDKDGARQQVTVRFVNTSVGWRIDSLERGQAGGAKDGSVPARRSERSRGVSRVLPPPPGPCARAQGRSLIRSGSVHPKRFTSRNHSFQSLHIRIESAARWR